MSEEQQGAPPPFDPSRFLTRVNGGDYLEIRWRLVWLREQHPDAAISTEAIDLGPDFALFKARVAIPGGGSATGHKSETRDASPDFIERAETGAIGRALAALGFGTQFALDLAGTPSEAPAPARGGDAARRQNAARDLQGRGQPNGAAVASIGPDQPATQRQLKYLEAVAREAGLDGPALDERAMEQFGVAYAALSRRDASTLIDLLQAGPQPAQAR